jgi:Delta7-sterol 5-desaturase
VLAALLGITLSIPGLFLVQLVFGLALYYGLSWLSYQYFFVWKKERYFPGEPDPDPAEDVSARKLAFWNLLGNAALGTPFQYWIFHGRGKLYWDISDHGWAYYLFSIVAYVLLTELGVYWAHRWLHHPVLYKHLHLYHHLYRKPTPWVSMAFHPIDSWLQALPSYLCVLFMPIHISIYATGFVFLMLWTFFIHDRVSLVRSPLVHYTAHHTIHHAYNKYNFGQFLTLFDRVFGSHKDPMKEQRFKVMFPPLPQQTPVAPTPIAARDAA